MLSAHHIFDQPHSNNFFISFLCAQATFLSAQHEPSVVCILSFARRTDAPSLSRSIQPNSQKNNNRKYKTKGNCLTSIRTYVFSGQGFVQLKLSVYSCLAGRTRGPGLGRGPRAGGGGRTRAAGAAATAGRAPAPPGAKTATRRRAARPRARARVRAAPAPRAPRASPRTSKTRTRQPYCGQCLGVKGVYLILRCDFLQQEWVTSSQKTMDWISKG